MKLALLEKWHKKVLIFFLVSTPDRVGAMQTRQNLLRWGEGGHIKRPPVFLQSGGSCLSTIVFN